VIAIERMRVAALRFNDYWAINTRLLLERGMAVIPVSAALTDREAVDEGLAGRNPGEAQTRHAVHRRRGADAVPMDRGRFGEPVRDCEGYRVALTPAQDGRGKLAVDRRR